MNSPEKRFVVTKIGDEPLVLESPTEYGLSHYVIALAGWQFESPEWTLTCMDGMYLEITIDEGDHVDIENGLVIADHTISEMRAIKTLERSLDEPYGLRRRDREDQDGKQD